MTNPQHEHDDYAIVECHVCLKEIPQSGAKAEEVCDYVAYFCGLECYQKWTKDEENTVQTTTK